MRNQMLLTHTNIIALCRVVRLKYGIYQIKAQVEVLS